MAEKGLNCGINKSTIMATNITVPDIGDFENVEIIEILVKPGDAINKNDPMVTLESDKSSVEVPSPFAGKISSIKVKIGDKVSKGSVLAVIEDEKIETSEEAEKPEKPKEQKKEKIKPLILKNEEALLSKSLIYDNILKIWDVMDDSIKRGLQNKGVLKAMLEVIEETLGKFDDDLNKLQNKLNEAKAKQRTVEIRMQTAEKRVKMKEKLHSGQIDDALLRYEQMERRIDELEADADSWELGRGQSLEEQFEDLEAELGIEDDLKELKARVKKDTKKDK